MLEKKTFDLVMARPHYLNGQLINLEPFLLGDDLVCKEQSLIKRKIAVFNLPALMTSDQLTKLLSKYGEIVECALKKNFLDNLGFVTFKS